MDSLKIVVAGTVIIGFNLFLGWILGSSQIGHECRAVGTFYVGKSVYDCKLRAPK